MDAEAAHYFRVLQSAEGSADLEYEALKNVLRVTSSSEVVINEEIAERIHELARSTKQVNVRNLALRVILSLLASKANYSFLIDKRLVNLALKCVTDTNVSVHSLRILALVVASAGEDLVEYAVSKGTIDAFFKNASHQNNASVAISLSTLQLQPQLREASLQGLASLALHPSYAFRLHEKDIWALIFRLYEEGHVTLLSLKVIKSVVQGCNTFYTSGSWQKLHDLTVKQNVKNAQAESENGNEHAANGDTNKGGDHVGDDNESKPEQLAHAAETPGTQKFETNLRNSMRASLRTSIRNSSRNFDRKQLDQAIRELNEEMNTAPTRSGYTEEEGLLREQYLDEAGVAKLDLPALVCMSIDRKGIMSLILSVCQGADQEALAEMALSILGLMSRSIHKVITWDNRIVIVRVLLSLIEFMHDKRLISVAYVLDTLLAQKGNRSIVMQCGTAIKCATAGIKLLPRKDGTSVKVCHAITQVLFNISSIPDGPAELSNPQCISFLRKSLRNIAQVELKRNAKGEEMWSSRVEILALVTLINVATQSPIMSTVSAADLHRALAAAAKRQDELGLLAIIGSSIFLNKSGPSSRSREIPKLHGKAVSMLGELLRNSRFATPSPGGIDWTTEELLEATSLLVQAPQNQLNMRPMLPSIIETLRDVVDRGEEDNAGLAIEILLEMSYNKHIAKALATTANLDETLLKALDVVPPEMVRAAQALRSSLANEMHIEESLAATFKERVISISRSSLQHLSLGRKTSGRNSLQAEMMKSADGDTPIEEGTA